MTKIVMSSGHSKKVRGAAGSPRPPYLEEVDEARRVVNKTAEYLRAAGVQVTTFHDDVSTSQNENLDRIVDFHNAQGKHDLDVSVHFNANATTSSPMGTEVLWVTQEALAKKVSAAIAKAGGFKDRGPKYRDGLAFLNGTAAPSVLLEICFVDSSADGDLYRKNFDAICRATAESLAGVEVEAPAPGPTPPVEPVKPPEVAGDDDLPTLGKGDKGPDVVQLQKMLGVLEPDGDFGPTTETWVKAFQGAAKLTPDGVVGPKTWEAVLDLQDRVDEGKPPLPKELADEIYTAAQTSEIADYSWRDRGIAPPGYIAGMALSFAHALMRLQDGDESMVADHMSQAAGDPAKDALAFFKDEFAKLGMSNKIEGVECLRHLFVLQIGLGPRESSGRYFEGRDLSASNVASDTAEAGLTQTSWNIRNGSSVIAPLLPEFWENPNGFLSVFREGLSPTKDNLDSYGSGDGLRYQFLSRFCPLFHVLVTGCGLRVLKDHWGPVKRKELELKKEADVLLKEVQAMVEAVS